MKKKWYLGIVGPIASGKEEFADYLIKRYGFATFSLSTVLHKELEKKGIVHFTRQTLQDIGDKLRAREGDGVLAKKAIEFLQEDGRSVVITGIRNPGEVNYLKKLPNFILVGINASKEIRFKRIILRGKPWDPKNWQEFLKVNKRDLGVGQVKSGQHVGKCLKLVDHQIKNENGLVTLYKKIERFIKKFNLVNQT